MAVAHRNNPNRYVEVRGRALLEDDDDPAFIDSIAQHYMGVDRYPFDRPGQERVTVTIVAQPRVDARDPARRRPAAGARPLARLARLGAAFDGLDLARERAGLAQPDPGGHLDVQLVLAVDAEVTGDVEFHDCTNVMTLFGGGSDDATFVQVMRGRVTDRAKLAQLEPRSPSSSPCSATLDPT